MKTFQTEVTVSPGRCLTIELPESLEAGTYQVVVVMNPSASDKTKSQSQPSIDALAGQVRAFRGVDAVAWQRQTRDAWND